jgi:hypothetical protein
LISVLDVPDQGQDTESGRLFYFLKLPRNEEHRKGGALCSHPTLNISAIQRNGRAAFGHFIAKMRSLEDGRGGPEAGGAAALGEGSGEREDKMGR